MNPGNKKMDSIPGWLVGMLVGVFGSLLLFRKLLFVSPEKYLWADDYDTRLMYWIVNWGYHSLFELKQPLRFWNANSFYPESNTLAYSDSLLSIQLFFAPFKGLHIPSMTALYLALAFTCILGSLLTAVALKRFRVFSNLEIALIVFVTHFGLSFTSFLYHYQLFGFHFGPALFLYLYLYLRDYRKRDLVFISILYCLGTAFATYFAPMVLTVALILAIPLIIVRWRQSGLRGLLGKIGWRSLFIPLPFILLLYFVQIQPYQVKFSDLPPVKLEIFQTFSASIASIYKCSSQDSFWYGLENCPYEGSGEYPYFPGFLLLGSALLFFLSFFISIFPGFRKTGVYAKFFKPDPAIDRVLPWFFMIFFFAVWFLSLGPHLYILNLPSYLYILLLKIIPGLDHVRTPGRFGILLGLPLSFFLVLLLRRIQWKANVQRVALIAAFLAVGIETLPDHQLYPVNLDPVGIYSLTAQSIPADTPLLELPVWNKKHTDLIINVQKQLVGSTYHWARLMVGYGAASSPGFWKLVNLDLHIQKGSNINEILLYARQENINHYLVHLPDYPVEVQVQWRQLANDPSSCQFFEQDGYLLFEVNSRNCPH